MKYYLKVLLLSAMGMVFLKQESNATHIVGGELNYSYLTTIPSNNSACDSLYAFQVVVTVYRDAYNGIPPFDDPLTLKVYDGENEIIPVFNKLGQIESTFTMKATFVEKIEPMNTDSLCTSEAVLEQIQVERMRYIDTLFVCKNTTGYQLAYLRCCRNQDILNVVSSSGAPPGETGAVIYAAIPARIKNSNPIIDIDPNILICTNRPLEFSNSAFDLDGDSLVYKFCRAFEGCNPNDPFCGDQYFPPFDTVIFTPGYSLDNLLGGNIEPLTIDPQTGVVTAKPSVIGQHVVTMCVEEYRDGVYLSETRRDFQFNVLDCSVVTADFSAERKVCEGEIIPFQFMDESIDEVGVVRWMWDFGDGTISSEQNPLHEFEFGQTYSVSLIAFGANGCSDTIVQEINAAELSPLSLVDSIAYCGENSVHLPLEIEGQNTFSWAPNTSIDNVSAQNPLVFPLTQTTYTVTVNTILAPTEICTRTADILVIPDWPLPEVTLGPMDIQCDRVFSIPTSFANTNDASWTSFPDFSASKELSPLSDKFDVVQSSDSVNYYVAVSNKLCADTNSILVYQRGISSNRNNKALVCDATESNVTVNIDLALISNDPITQATITLNDSTWISTTGVFDVVVDQNESLIYEAENLSGCILIDTLQIVLSQSPEINIVEDTIIINSPGSLDLAANGDADLDYNWSPRNLFDNPTNQFPKANIEQSVLLTVEAENSDGCVSTDEVYVRLIPLSCNEDLIVVPSAFSPNSDGFNDLFKVRASSEVVELSLEIFNRWGKKIFSSEELDASWDGINEGQLLSTDVFGFVIRAVCDSGDSFIKKGNVTLIR